MGDADLLPADCPAALGGGSLRELLMELPTEWKLYGLRQAC